MYFANKELLNPPVSRAAYSDRTAWLMSETSRLAYFQFEGSLELSKVAQNLANDSDPESVETALNSLLSDRQLSSDAAKDELSLHLAVARFTLHSVFNHNETQAFLASSESHRMNVLAFRGTEKNLKDIKTDLKASMIEMDGVRVHHGFYQALECVRPEIEGALREVRKNGYPLYITGHSLGGAIALLATKFLAEDSIGACYTFGSPRVACSQFGDSIKTPVYRLVNAADGVPRVPPAYLQNALIAFFEVIRIPYVSDTLIKVLDKVSGYRHHGDMRYLTACKADHNDLRLLQNPSLIDRAWRLCNRVVTCGPTVIASDHSIQAYSTKLSAYAEKRSSASGHDLQLSSTMES
ncbi:Mbeg1-like protein [Endozoicomonas sp. YOMI1]|uniref:lipase family protein n=1 Tax=Endozoicomonas sp. YOMI1 TaxID=2828739 RepID=UPI002149817E|nr:lipase family protein [Endozoicomonas sp. YOMI1]